MSFNNLFQNASALPSHSSSSHNSRVSRLKSIPYSRTWIGIILSGVNATLFQKRLPSTEYINGEKNMNKVLAVAMCIVLALSVASCDKISGSKGGGEEKFQSLMKSALDYKEAEKFNEARIQLRKASEIKPEDPEVYYELGEILIRLKKLREALENYNSAINLNPEHRKARLNAASIFVGPFLVFCFFPFYPPFTSGLQYSSSFSGVRINNTEYQVNNNKCTTDMFLVLFRCK